MCPTDSDNPPTTFPAIRRAMMPRDTNSHGTIFGGVILAEIDLAAGIEARMQTRHPVVTVALDDVEFKEPVQVGDVVSFHAETERVGRTSIRVKVDVWAYRCLGDGKWIHVTVAHVTMVAVDKDMRPTAIAPQ